MHVVVLVGSISVCMYSVFALCDQRTLDFLKRNLNVYLWSAEKHFRWWAQVRSGLYTKRNCRAQENLSPSRRCFKISAIRIASCTS